MKFYYEEGEKKTGHIFMGEDVTRSARIEKMRNTLIEAVPEISADHSGHWFCCNRGGAAT